MAVEITPPQLQSEIEKELTACIGASSDPRYAEYEAMFTYQMDWELPAHDSRGKRVRPLLVLLTTHAAGGDWHQALPAAASLELMHNFSLIHDDIQDQSTSRRGKPTTWVKWGEPLAINAGDAMLTLSSLSLQRLLSDFPANIVNKVSEITHTACLQLTRGQFLDISFESRVSVSLDDYWEMISGKTCSLLAAALEIGGLLGGADETQCALLHQCGLALGKAYQVQDDWFGIWGNDDLTGKSSHSDLLARKKSYPILAGLAKGRSFYAAWSKIVEITPREIPALVSALEEDGIKAKTEAQMETLYRQTQTLLTSVNCETRRVAPLIALLDKLMKRVQ